MGGGSLRPIVALLTLAALATGLLAGPDRAVASGVTVTAIAAGNAHTCAVTTAGGVKCWGDNSSGQLGDGTQTLRTTPVVVCQTYNEATQRCTEVFSGASGSLALGLLHTCAATTAGGVKCWGWNGRGQLGNPDASCLEKAIIIEPNTIEPASGELVEAPCSTTPVEVVGLTDAVAVAAGSTHTCALIAGGRVKCWGENFLGQLGDGTTTSRLTPVDVCQRYDAEAGHCLEPSSGAAAIAATTESTCAVTISGAVKCWGWSSDGWLGTPTTEFCDFFIGPVPCSSTPLQIQGLESGVIAVSPSIAVLCVLTTAGGVKCGGGNGLGGLGDGQRCGIVCLSPADVQGLTAGVTSIDAGYSHTCAITAVGRIKCWGDNGLGQLGRETSERCGEFSRALCSTTPVDVTGLSRGAAVVTGGAFHTCAVTAAGGAKCWGQNCCGELGNGTQDYPITNPPHTNPVPTRVLGLGPKAPGDADCSGEVTSIDAALVLQLTASVIPTLPCPQNADADQNGAVDSLDAALMLQLVGGLIPAL